MEISQSIEEGKNQCFPNENQWNFKINEMIKELETHQDKKEEILKSFLKEIENEFSQDKQVLIKIDNVTQKMALAEEHSIKYMSLAMKMLQKVHQCNPVTEISLEGMMLDSSIGCNWLGLAVNAFNCHLRASIIKEYKNVLAQRFKELDLFPNEKSRINQNIYHPKEFGCS